MCHKALNKYYLIIIYIDTNLYSYGRVLRFSFLCCAVRTPTTYILVSHFEDYVIVDEEWY